MNEFFGQKKPVMMEVDENNPSYFKPVHKLDYGFFKLPFFDDYLPVITMDDKTCWFPASLVAKYMGYSNHRNAVDKLVFPIYKLKINKLLNYAVTGQLDAVPDSGTPSKYKYNLVNYLNLPNEFFSIDKRRRVQKQNYTVIMEAGLYQLIGKSGLPQAVNFVRWIYESVIPYAVRHTDQFTINRYKEVIEKQEQILKANHQYIVRQQEAYEDLLEERNALKDKLDAIYDYSDTNVSREVL